LAEQRAFSIKILYHHRVASKDGMYVHIEEIVRALRDAGHDVILCAPSEPRGGQFGSDSTSVAKLREKLPGFAHEILEFGYCLLDFLKLCKAILVHRPDCIYERYNLFLPSGIWAKSLFRLPLILEVNSPLYRERAQHSGLSLRRLARWTESYTWRHAHYVLPVTQVLADEVAGADVSPEKIVVIPNGIRRSQFLEPIDSALIRNKLGLQEKIVLGFTGFVRDWHGMDRVIELLAEYQDHPLHLLLVGDGPARANLERQAVELGVKDKITFTGVVQRAEVADYIAAFDIALQPDVVSYASPLKLFEYLALGKPVLAPDEPNIKEVLQHEVEALLFNSSEPMSFKRELIRLCTDQELREALGAGARRTLEARELFWDANARRIVDLFEEAGAPRT
jgi:glycosyltransferase involved in cell wall biosynthesis